MGELSKTPYKGVEQKRHKEKQNFKKGMASWVKGWVP